MSAALGEGRGVELVGRVGECRGRKGGGSGSGVGARAGGVRGSSRGERRLRLRRRGGGSLRLSRSGGKGKCGTSERRAGEREVLSLDGRAAEEAAVCGPKSSQKVS